MAAIASNLLNCLGSRIAGNSLANHAGTSPAERGRRPVSAETSNLGRAPASSSSTNTLSAASAAIARLAALRSNRRRMASRGTSWPPCRTRRATRVPDTSARFSPDVDELDLVPGNLRVTHEPDFGVPGQGCLDQKALTAIHQRSAFGHGKAARLQLHGWLVDTARRDPSGDLVRIYDWQWPTQIAARECALPSAVRTADHPELRLLALRDRARPLRPVPSPV